MEIHFFFEWGVGFAHLSLAKKEGPPPRCTDGKRSNIIQQETTLMSSTPDASGSDAAKPGLTDPTLDERIGQQWYQPRSPRAVLKELMKRSDAEGLRNFVPWLLLLVAPGLVAPLSCGPRWAVPAFFCHRASD